MEAVLQGLQLPIIFFVEIMPDNLLLLRDTIKLVARRKAPTDDVEMKLTRPIVGLEYLEGETHATRSLHNSINIYTL